MSKTFVMDSLRVHLKARQLTYRDLAKGLKLSEVSVKRLFSRGDCSLARLEQICQFMQIEFSDLFKTAPRKRKLISQLTHAQETELAHNKQLLMVAICALSLWRVQDMCSHLKLSLLQCESLMRRLDAIGFLELEATNQYRLLVSNNFSWITMGPIMLMVQSMSHEYFNNPFDGEGEVLRIVNVRISNSAQTLLRNRLEQIALEYADQARADAHLPLKDRPPVSVCIAARRWVPSFMLEMLVLPQASKPDKGRHGA